MLNYPMRTISKCGKYLVDFTLQDGPCPVDGVHFVLTERPGSPILMYDQVSRGFDIPNIYEGDIIEDEDGEEYIVAYFRGFGCQSLKTQKYSEFPGKFKVVSNIYKRGREKDKKASHRFKYNDTLFTLQEIYGLHEGKLVVNVESALIDPQEVKQYSGLRSQSRKMLFFGDDNLHLKNGRLCVEKDGAVLDILNKEHTIE